MFLKKRGCLEEERSALKKYLPLKTGNVRKLAVMELNSVAGSLFNSGYTIICNNSVLLKVHNVVTTTWESLGISCYNISVKKIIHNILGGSTIRVRSVCERKCKGIPCKNIWQLSNEV